MDSIEKDKVRNSVRKVQLMRLKRRRFENEKELKRKELKRKELRITAKVFIYYKNVVLHCGHH